MGTSGSDSAATCPHFLLLPSPILGLHWVLVQVEGPGVGKFHRKIEPHPEGDLLLVYFRKKCYLILAIRIKYDVKEEQMAKDKGKGKDKEKKKKKKDAK